MSKHDDAYGQLIYDFHHGQRTQEIIERDDGFITTSSGPAAYFTEYDDWPQDQQQAVNLAHGRILDIGCGAGRHALHLQNKGMDVVGIDVSPLAIKTCQERGLRHVRVLNITQVNSSLGRFDTIIMMGSNFGLFGNVKRAKWLFRRFHAITSGTATILAESADPYATDKPYHLAYHKRNQESGRLAGQLRIRVRYQTYRSDWFDYLKVSRDEMKMIVDGTGWHVARFIPETGATYVGVIEKS